MYSGKKALSQELLNIQEWLMNKQQVMEELLI
jgi:hypothetical protein